MVCDRPAVVGERAGEDAGVGVVGDGGEDVGQRNAGLLIGAVDGSRVADDVAAGERQGSSVLNIMAIECVPYRTASLPATMVLVSVVAALKLLF